MGRYYLGFLFFIVLGGCQSSKTPTIKDTPLSTLYQQGMDHLHNKKWTEATTVFEDVERQYPFSVWSQKALLMAGYAAFKAKNFSQALGNINNFIALYPVHTHIDYAYYLKALCYFYDMRPFNTDSEKTLKALEVLNLLIVRFPQSEYAKDAMFKRDFIQERLAAKVMEQAWAYMREKSWVSALQGFRTIITTYPKTRYAEESLFRLWEILTFLGVTQEANLMKAMLKHNFPQSSWLKHCPL